MTWLRRLPLLPLALLLVLALSGAKCPLANSDDDSGDPDPDCDDVYLYASDREPAVTTGDPWHATWIIDSGTPPYTGSVVSGSLPPGLDISASEESLRVEGSPEASGNYHAVLRLTDSCPDEPTTDDVSVNLIVIDPGACPPLTYLGISQSILTLGVNAVVYIRLEGGFGDHDAELVSGELPPGMSLTGSPTLIGTPTQEGVFTFRARFFDACPDGGSAFEQDITVEVSADYCRPIDPTPISPAVAAVGAEYVGFLTNHGGVNPQTYEILDPENLPPGLVQVEDGAGGVRGTPTQAGDYTFTFRVTDSCPAGSQILDWPCTITVLPPTGECSPLLVGDLEPVTAEVGTPYSASIPVTGGVPRYVIYWNGGELPPGITLEVTDGYRLVGQPLFAGVYTFEYEIRDSCPYERQAVFKTFTLTVSDPAGCAPLVYADTPLPVAHVDAPYDYTLPVSGGEAPLHWTLVDFAAPAMEFVDGRIVGTPFTSGTYTLECYVTDSCPGEPGYVYINTTLTIDP